MFGLFFGFLLHLLTYGAHAGVILKYAWLYFLGWLLNPVAAVSAGGAMLTAVQQYAAKYEPAGAAGLITSLVSELNSAGVPLMKLALYFVGHFIQVNVFAGAVALTAAAVPGALVLRFVLFLYHQVWGSD
jgi:hypothetical protein